jgi:fatty-acyl-CoA synthase
MAAGLDSLSFEPLTPLAYLRRSSLVFAERTAVVDGDRRLTYAELAERVARHTGALARLGVEPGERVAVLSGNNLLALEAPYAIPARGGVLVALNFRLNPTELRDIVEHAGARILLTDAEHEPTAREVAAAAPNLRVVTADELEHLSGTADPHPTPVTDERGLISLNYTSGTTGRPKGVMYHHRGAALQALAMAYHSRLACGSVFLWTLPMFHCNGWCFTWGVTAAGATHVCLPKVDPAEVWRLIRAEGVTHFNGAPTVLTMILADPAAGRVDPRIHVCTGGAPPSPTLLARCDEVGFEVTHLYGLTETFGPVVICEPQPGWASLDPHGRADMLARQGVGNVIAFPPRVVDFDGRDVPPDGLTLGEVALRGNDLMLGYYHDPELTKGAAPDGWFRTGDIAVMHPDGYFEIKDRSKDVIISGGENIASIEVEQALLSHPDVREAAVVSAPDEKWGEVPVAFVELAPGAELREDEMIEHVKSRLARYKAPRRILVAELPRTSTGKIMKYELRERVRELQPAAPQGP